VAVWNLISNTVISTYKLSSGVNTSWKVVGTGDLNGDGFADIVWRHANGTVAAWLMQNGQVAVTQFLLENGFNAAEFDPGWEVRAVGDLDGDGKSDIIWQHNTGVLAAWLMDGITVRQRVNFSAFLPPASASSWIIAGAGDLNMDGKADIIWQNNVSGLIGAWLMDGNVVIGQSNLSIDRVADTNWKIHGVGDTNGDGFADIIWQNTATGGLAVWFLRAFQVLQTSWLSIGAVPDPNWHVVGPG
jgi:hypothetical protein